MYRTSMPENHGMIFVFEDTKVRQFWMHNTCLSLDMFFVTADGTIAGILDSVPTLNDAIRSVGIPVRYVIETNAGFARKYGVKAGQKVTLPPL